MSQPHRSATIRALIADRRVCLGAQAIAAGSFLGGAAGFLADRYSWPHPLVIAVGVALLFAAVVVISQTVSWKHHPDRAKAKTELDQWMRARALPEHVPLGEALPLIAAHIDRNQRDLWSSALLSAVYVGEVLLRAFDPPVDGLTIALFSLPAAYGIGALGRVIYYRTRWIPVLRQLLADGQRRFAT